MLVVVIGHRCSGFGRFSVYFHLGEAFSFRTLSSVNQDSNDAAGVVAKSLHSTSDAIGHLSTTIMLD